jgi:flagellar hook-associated protein 3 FlgL
MGSIRVTQQILVDRTLRNLNRLDLDILRLQEQLATGLRVNRPSDDPLSARRAINVRTEISKNEQFLSNISNLRPGMSATETAMFTTIDALQRVRELALQGANGTNGLEQRVAIANEVDQFLEALVIEGNVMADGRHVFSGTNTLTQPFEFTRNVDGEIDSVTYVGNTGEIQTEISEGVLVVANVNGEDAFQPTAPGAVDIFDLLITLREDLQANDGNAAEAALTDIDTALDQVLIIQSRIGALQNRLERTDSNFQDVNLQLETVLSDNVDADFADVIVNLNAQTSAFQAALSASARIIQPTLLDFLG